MSFQAYLDNIEANTSKTPNQFMLDGKSRRAKTAKKK